ncbi:MAG: phosphoglucosamine mutase [Bacteroidetes bacterium]|nr:MAG: phosphoglucosamine mutase [Bacteroidota bacterium]
MTLIKSISGIRGTIGGAPGEGLTPVDIIKFTTAYGIWLSRTAESRKVIIGRDARISGEMVRQLVSGTLMSLGYDVVDLGFSTTPTVEMAVTMEGAAGGIILTASHNPKQWNALKLLNSKGEFISAESGQELLRIADEESVEFMPVDKLGSYTVMEGYIDKHIEKILEHPLVDVKAIKDRKFKIVVDAVNSTGGIAVPALLRALGVETIHEIYCTPDGKFPHNPEPLPEHLGAISGEVKFHKADLGVVVDPDVDRLAIVCEDGSMFGEEYTLVAVADYVLQHKKGNTVSNLSSSRALRDVTEKHGGSYFASAVGEVNVVEKMKEVEAVIGGEGNGGIIVPELHYGRDALIGIALFLSHLAKFGKMCSFLRETYPDYHIAKKKIQLEDNLDLDALLAKVSTKYAAQPQNTIDGLKIEFDKEWVHLRKSNTEPIIRIYAESAGEATANTLADKLISDMKEILNGR